LTRTSVCKNALVTRTSTLQLQGPRNCKARWSWLFYLGVLAMVAKKHILNPAYAGTAFLLE